MPKRPSKPTLAAKRTQWLEVLAGEDQHSISRQITQMAWDAAAFQVVNRARGLAPSAPEGGVQVNGLMHKLLDRTFFASQMAAVRRLMDTSNPLEGKKGVCSLAKLLEDMFQYHRLFIREAIFDAEALEYDYEPIRQKREEYGLKKMQAGEHSYHVPKELWWEVHEDRHEQIDRLADVKPSDRRPDDTIQKAVFSNLTEKVKTACEDIKNHATKFIAHAATSASRSSVKEITLNDLWEAHRNLCHVTGFVATYILGESCASPLPHPQYDQFKYMERPLVAKSQIGELQDLWNRFDEESNSWNLWGLDEYEQDFANSQAAIFENHLLSAGE